MHIYTIVFRNDASGYGMKDRAIAQLEALGCRNAGFQGNPSVAWMEVPLDVDPESVEGVQSASLTYPARPQWAETLQVRMPHELYPGLG